jgi:hypothetical protein
LKTALDLLPPRALYVTRRQVGRRDNAPNPHVSKRLEIRNRIFNSTSAIVDTWHEMTMEIDKRALG